MILSKKYLLVVILIFNLFLDDVCTIDFMVVTKTHIRTFSNGTEKTKVDLGLYSMVSVAYDSSNRIVYFNDLNNTGRISRITLKITGEAADKVTTVVDQKDKPVKGIAYDYNMEKLFWFSDNDIYFVRVSPDDISNPLTGKPLLKLNEESLGGFAIDGYREYLYWWSTDQTGETKIKELCLNKPGRNVLVEDLTKPQSIMVDIEKQMLYWIDLHKDGSRSLQSLELWGLNARYTQVKTDDPKELMPYVMELGHVKVYWMDCKSRKIWRMYKSTSRDDHSPELESNIEVEDCPIGLFMLSDSDAEEQQASNAKQQQAGDEND